MKKKKDDVEIISEKIENTVSPEVVETPKTKKKKGVTETTHTNSDGTQIVTKTVIKKRGGVFSFFMGFLFCLFFLIVSLVGTFLYCYYNVTLNQIESLLGVQLPIEGEIRDKALKDLLALGLEYKDSITEATLQTIEEDFGVELPTTIPGTEIGLTAIYTANITFMNETKPVREYRIQDIVNNLNEFVEAVLPVFYDNTTVQQILNTAQVDILNDLDYPALTDKYYNVGTAENPDLKSLSELTISQVLEQLPERFGSENLTVQEIVNAVGLEIMPYPEGDNQDVYAGLRNLLITQITTDDLLNSVDGAFLNAMLDLTHLEFTQTDEFNATKLIDMIDYIETVPFNQIIEIPATMPDETSPAADHLLYALQNVTYQDLSGENMVENLTAKMNAVYPNFTLGKIIDFGEMSNLDFLASISVTEMLNDPTTAINDTLQNVYIGDFVTLGSLFREGTTFESGALRNIPLDTYLSDLRVVISGLTLNEILSSEQIASGNLSAYSEMTLLEILQANDGSTLGEILNSTTPNLTESVGAYVLALSNATASTFESELANATILNLIGSENNPSALARLADMNLREIADDPDLIDTLLENFGTLGELIGSNDGILGIIGDVAISDLLGDDPSGAIMSALENSNMTLSEMLNSTASDNEMVNSILNITVGELFGSDDLSSVIENALSGDGQTLGDLLGINENTGIMSYVQNVEMSALFGDNPGDAIINAIIGNASDGWTTLGDFLNNQENSGIMSMINGVYMRDLLGRGTITAGQALENALCADDRTLGDLFEIASSDGLVGLVSNVKLSDLFAEGANPGDAIINAIIGNESDGWTTLGEFLSNEESSGLISMINGVYMRDLLGEGEISAGQALENALCADNRTLGDLFEISTSTDPVISAVVDISLSDLFGDNASTTLSNALDDINLSAIIGSTNKPAIFNLITNYDTLTIGDLSEPNGIQIESNITIQVLINAGILDADEIPGIEQIPDEYTLTQIIIEYIELKYGG